MSLPIVCRQLVLEVVLRRALAADDSGESAGRMQLIVDETMLKILSSFLKMGDLHAEGVTSMELIERQREPLPGLDALYLFEPKPANVDMVIGDFKTESAPQHRCVHLAFSHSLAQELMNKLAEGKNLAPRVKSFLEVPLSFVLIQDRGFHFDMLDALPRFFPVADPGLASDVAHRLADVCRCLQVASPCIRHAESPACKAIAEHVQEELSVSRGGKEGQLPCQLLIIDRSFDMAATLVHEYTYEAVAYDLLDGVILNVDSNVVSLAGPPARELLLSDADPLWDELKHKHLEEVQNVVNVKVEDVKRQNADQDASQISTGALLDMLRRSPEQRDAMDRLLLHMTLIEQIFTRLRQERLMAQPGIGLLEQDIACGVDEKGKDVKSATMQAQLTDCFAKFTDLASETKLRLLMLYFACMANISEGVRQKLIEMARLEAEDQDVLMAMIRTKLMDVPNSQRHRLGNGPVSRVTREQAERFKRNAKSDGRFQLSRFEPRVKEVIEQLTQGRLSEDDFPVLEGSDTPGNSLRTAGLVGCSAPGAPSLQPADQWSFAAWPGAGKSPAAEAAGDAPAVTQRIILFVVGGITHSELRAAAEVAQGLPRGTEVLLGGTALLTPRKFIHALRPKGGGTSMPSGAEDALDLT